jgi:Surface antigen variable number repeat
MKITLTSIFFLLVVFSTASAAIQPSFSPQGCSWRATDIVVVTEGSEIDGKFKVLETWKGDLKPGQTISVPELAKFKGQETRVLPSTWRDYEGDGKPEYVTGERMILFLRDAEKVPDDPDDDASASRWKGTNPMGSDMKYSTVWIENGKVYCFTQLMNPGDPVLAGYVPESELKTDVDCVVSTQTALNTALAITDVTARAESLEPFAKDSIFWARDQAFAGLTDCGEAAFPVLRRMLDNESLREFHGDVVETFAQAGGKAVGPELTAWFEREVEFWKRTAPALQPGWWNGAGFGGSNSKGIEAVEPLRTRYSVLLRGIYALGVLRYRPAERVLIELDNLTRTAPQMDFDQLTHACDEVLRDSGSDRKGLRAPKYEIGFSGNKAFSSSLLKEKVAEYVVDYDKLQKDWERDIGGGPVDYAMDRLMGFYISHGYLQVGFNSEQRSTEHGPLTLLEINEGKAYRLGKVRITGSKLISADRIKAMLTLREGDIADGEVLRKWKDDLRKIYRDQGCLDFYADDDPQYSVDPQSGADVVDYNVKIEERSRYRVEAIKFAGKLNISRDQLLRAMSLHEGEIFSQKQLDDSIDELNKLGLTLNEDKDVIVTENHARERVTIKIILDEHGRAKEKFDRSSVRAWFH